MSYLVRVKRKVFSRSGHRMVEQYIDFEYKDRKKAHLFANEQKENPMTIEVRIFKEEEDAK